jgi:hypothetical protein
VQSVKELNAASLEPSAAEDPSVLVLTRPAGQSEQFESEVEPIATENFPL